MTAQLRVLAILACVLFLADCRKTNQYAAPPPPKVTVATPVAKKVTHYFEASGNTQAVNSVDLVARVQGFLQQINYADGATVKTGDVLFVIEPLPWQARLDQAQAAEAGAKAQLVNAEASYSRQLALQQKQVASVQSLDDARAARDSAMASLAQAKSNTQLAAINYSYTRVVAPFDGRVSAHLVSIGNLVGSLPTKLATIVQVDPIYVTFNINEQDLQRVRVALRRRGVTRADLQKIPVEAGLQSDTGYPHAGHLDYAAPTVDPSTGTMAVRGVLDNANIALLPGYFVRVRVPIETGIDALLVPDVALNADQAGPYVLVVDADNIVAQRHVTLGSQDGTMRAIESGLKPDERVVVAGLQRAAPGQKVDPVLAPEAAR